MQIDQNNPPEDVGHQPASPDGGRSTESPRVRTCRSCRCGATDRPEFQKYIKGTFEWEMEFLRRQGVDEADLYEESPECECDEDDPQWQEEYRENEGACEPPGDDDIDEEDAASRP